jgi:hypothetical protein
MPIISRPAAISKSLDMTNASWDHEASLSQALNTVSARVKAGKPKTRDSKNVSFSRDRNPISDPNKKPIFGLNPYESPFLMTRIENESFNSKIPKPKPPPPKPKGNIFRDRTVSNRPIKIDDNDVFRFDIRKKSRQIKDFTVSNKKGMVNFLTKLPKRRPEKVGMTVNKEFDQNLIESQ